DGLGSMDRGKRGGGHSRTNPPGGKEQEKRGGGSGNRHIPEILPGSPLGRKPRTDTGSSVREVLNRNAVFLLKRFHQNIAAIGSDRTDDGDFPLLFSSRQNFLPLLAEG